MYICTALASFPFKLQIIRSVISLLLKANEFTFQMKCFQFIKPDRTKNCASKLRCKEKKGGNWQTTKQVRWKNITGSCI